MAPKTTIMVSSTFKTIAMTTIVTSILWTGYGVYSALKKPPEVNVSAAILAPVNPNIDKETLNKLQERRQVTEEVATDQVVQQALTILQIEPSAEKTASSGATSTPTTQEKTASPAAQTAL